METKDAVGADGLTNEQWIKSSSSGTDPNTAKNYREENKAEENQRKENSDYWNNFVSNVFGENGVVLQGGENNEQSWQNLTFAGFNQIGWDKNGDGKLQKSEADYHYIYGLGKSITVDGNKIDLSGLEAKNMTYNPKTRIYSLSTTEAFKVLPWETAATYGGSNFKLVFGKWQMQSQEYHYNMRNWNSVENVKRNILTILGDPSNTLRPSEMNKIHGNSTPTGTSFYINIIYKDED